MQLLHDEKSLSASHAFNPFAHSRTPRATGRTNLVAISRHEAFLPRGRERFFLEHLDDLLIKRSQPREDD